jgi:hypothetical protein
MYRTNDGQVLKTISAAEVVSELHGLSFSPCADDQEFMVQTAERVSVQFEKRVRSDSPEHFVEDLIAAGLLVAEVEV